MKPNGNSVEVHSQLSNNRHPLDGAVVVAGSLWPHIILPKLGFKSNSFAKEFE
jgi:hypothetical protein